MRSWALRSPTRRAIDVLAVAVAGGVAAGVVHSLELFAAAGVRHELVFFSREFVWMAPLAYTLVFLVPALVLAVIAALTGRNWVLALTIFVVALLAVFGVLLPYLQIARIASLALALGAATQITRLAMASPDVWLRWMKRFGVGGVAASFGWALISSALRTRAEQRALAAYPAAPEGSPNVLLLVLDTVRASALGLYGGDPATTPALSRWARDGVRFEWAMSVAPWTLPSHASMFTGRYAGETSATWRTALDAKDSTLAEAFLRRGYATGGFVGNMHYTSWESGLTRGFATYDDYRRSAGQLIRSSSYTQTLWFQTVVEARTFRGIVRASLRPRLTIQSRHVFHRKYASAVVGEFLDWQSQLGRRPFFAFLNFFDAHNPYYAPPEFKRFKPSVGEFHTYQGSLAYLDVQIDSLLTTLRSRGVLDNTIVIITSDHGEQFKEHDLTGHGNSLYLELLHVPLLVRYPRAVPSDATVRATVSLRDLAATIIDLSGLPGAHFPGRSLRATWEDSADAGKSPILAEIMKSTNTQATYPSSRGNMASLLDDHGHYIKNGDGRDELYFYRVDTAEIVDSAAGPGGAERVARWRARTDSLLRVHRR